MRGPPVCEDSLKAFVSHSAHYQEVHSAVFACYHESSPSLTWKFAGVQFWLLEYQQPPTERATGLARPILAIPYAKQVY